PSTRLNKGHMLLANAQMVDTRPVQGRLDSFMDVHRRYIEAQVKVDEAVALERAERQRIEQLDGTQDQGLTAVAGALLVNGEPRRNVFARFADRAPGQMSALPCAEKAKAIHNLAANLHRSMGVPEALLVAAAQAEEAACKLEEALPGWELRRGYLSVTRQSRDAL